MNSQIVKFSAEPPVTRFVYVQTFLVIIVGTQIFNVAAQWQVPYVINWKVSSLVSLILSVVIAYALTLSPLTKSLAIDYGKRLVVVGFATLTRANNTLEIPFARLGVDTDAPADAASSDAKWRTHLLLDGKRVYLFLSSENGFTAAQLNEFNGRVRDCQEVGKNLGKII